MSNNGAALLGGLLIGGLVVGAAMSAENAAERQNRRNYARYNRPIHQQQQINTATYCICGAKMVQGRIQQGIAKCNNLNCQKMLTGSVCYYCPNGGNVQQHRNGFFYCESCAIQLKRGNKVIAQPKPQPQQYSGYPASNLSTSKAYIVKQGYMSKKGNWFNTSYKKRWFKLWSNKKMAYLTHPGASYTKGYADFTKISKMERKGKHGFEITTSERVWSFLCQSEAERNNWFNTIQTTCTNVPIKPQVKYVPAPQPQVKYVPQPQPQVKYVPVQPQPQPQPQKPMVNNNNNNFQPGMIGYNVGDMYGGNNESKMNNNMNINNNNNNVQKWENNAPPPAYADASAPPEDDINVIPSAPPAPDDEDQQEGAFTGQ